MTKFAAFFQNKFCTSQTQIEQIYKHYTEHSTDINKTVNKHIKYYKQLTT